MSGYVDYGPKVKAWVKGVAFEDAAQKQVQNCANMPFVRGVAIMPDTHFGMGATVGSVIATHKAIIPAAVGVDIGCGMVAVRTTLTADDLPDNLEAVRLEIERAVPHGRTNNGGAGDRGAWSDVPASVNTAWAKLDGRFKAILDKYPKIGEHNARTHLGSLGSGNHFIEVCLDLENRVWLMLHSGSRGVGNRIGQLFINQAKEEMLKKGIGLVDKDLAYLEEGSDSFSDYIEAMTWAQDFAMTNRQVMLERALGAMRKHLPPFQTDKAAVNCHHNYATKEVHFGEELMVTRKGAVNASRGTLGIIPGSMGARSFIVEGLGNPDSYCSCSHGAGRVMSRTQAKKEISMEEHASAMQGVEYRRGDESLLDESPRAYKPIEDVMAAQSDLIVVRHELRQVVNVKG